MDTTTYGYKKPTSGTRAKGSSGWMQALNYNTDRLDDHNHDGSNSALLEMSSFTPYTNTIAAASWSASGAGYKQTVTVPAGVTDINNYNVKFVASAPAGVASQIIQLHYKRLTATTYELYCNDATLALTAIYR
jgi:hypothetical protein